MLRTPTPEAESASTFGWGAAILGGVAAVACASLLSTTIAIVAQWAVMSGRVSRDQAHAALASGYAGVLALLTVLAAAISCALSGYMSAKYGRGRPLAQATTAGAVAALLFGAIYLRVSANNPVWFVVCAVVLPLVSGAAGGWAYARRI